MNDLRQLIADLEKSMMDFRINMARIISELYAIEHHLQELETNGVSASNRKVFDMLDNHFSLSEIDDICFELGYDPENLKGETKKERARSLYLTAVRRDRLAELSEIISRQRPFISGI